LSALLNNLIFTASHSTKISGLPLTEIGTAVGRDQRYGSDKVIIYAMKLVNGKSVNGMLDASTDKSREFYKFLISSAADLFSISVLTPLTRT
jgi:hypothetical protein